MPHPTPARGAKPTAFISSTSIDLKKHRRQVVDACLRMGYDPVGMEQWPAQDADAETVCLREVEACDLFIGIYAFRYGWIPDGHEVSITELEYDRAKEKGKPRILLFMDEKYASVDMVEVDGLPKLVVFKKRVEKERVRNLFTTPKDLRGLLIQALEHHKHSRGDAPVDPAVVGVPIPTAPEQAS